LLETPPASRPHGIAPAHGLRARANALVLVLQTYSSKQETPTMWFDTPIPIPWRRHTGPSRGQRRHQQFQAAAGHRPTFVPRIEALEDRTVLSTLTVTSTADDGSSGTLRALLATASPGDTIQFAPQLSGKTITLKQGQLLINKTLAIQGSGANRLTISGNGASRVFDVTGSGTVSIAGLSITHGLASVGGGILQEGSATLSLTNCSFSNNEALGNAVGGGLGGGIEDSSQGALTVSNCSFDQNQAVDVGLNTIAPGITAPLALGGAIDVSANGTGAATISNSTFTGNKALGGSPGATAGGGALNNSSPVGTMTVTDCTFNSNAAIGAAGGDGVAYFGSGQGGGINTFGSLIVLHSSLRDNLALGAPLAPGVAPSQTSVSGTSTAGGGIFAFFGFLSGVAVLTITDSSITGNQAVGGSGAPGAAGSVGQGGGISIFAVPSGLVAGCSITDNEALGGAGGSGGVGAAGVGGGIDLAISSVTVRNTTLARNQAIGGAGGFGAKGGDGVGGGMDVGSGVVLGFPESASLTLSGSALDHNQAVGGAGGSGNNGGNGLGGGLSVLGNSALISNTTVSQNQALGGEGDSGGNGGNGFGGGIYIGGASMGTVPSVSLTGCSVTGNTAVGGKAHGGSTGKGIGGGVYNLGVFSSIATVITHNKASTSNDDIFT
jgi:hypothetical protein